jgi:hypothetical protein
MRSYSVGIDTTTGVVPICTGFCGKSPAGMECTTKTGFPVTVPFQLSGKCPSDAATNKPFLLATIATIDAA